MSAISLPEVVPNWVGGKPAAAAAGETLTRLSPATGKPLCRLARSRPADVQAAVASAKQAQPAWAALPAVRRGEVLLEVVFRLRERRQEMAAVVAAETGKSPKAALGETDGAISLGSFFAGEGQRLYGRTMPSGVPNRQNMTVRCPVGVAGLIIAANTPIANAAWKVFPALVCGNAAVLKAAEDTPASAWLLARIAHEAGLPAGVLNVVQGLGPEAGAPLVEHPDVGVVSFTGSTAVGRQIARAAGERLARVSLELGGKNPFVVCDDADLDTAAHWAVQSAFSNAGQRCAAGSRVIVFESIYEKFVELLVAKTRQLKVGPTDADDFGPVVNERQLGQMLRAVAAAKEAGARVLAGGGRLTTPAHQDGFYMAPTWIDQVAPDADISRCELFGPIACLFKAKDFRHAVALANDSPYGLTAAVHTGSVHRALAFTQQVEAGVVSVNAGTFGSEPHLPFGGPKQSGNGTREPGTEAIDVYSSLKNVYLNHLPGLL